MALQAESQTSQKNSEQIVEPQSELAALETKRVEEEHPLYIALVKASVLAFGPVFAATVIWSGIVLWQANLAWAMLILLPLGLLSSDFTSGLFHWFFDNYGSTKTPVFGPTIELFRVHHDLPHDICNSNFTFTVGHVCLWSVPMVAAHLGLLAMGVTHPLFAAWTAFFTTAHLFLILTNQFHKWAHLSVKTPFITWLQSHKWVLNTPHHEVHHTPPYETYYCITTGWMNPILYKIKFFPRMEALLAKVGVNKAHG